MDACDGIVCGTATWLCAAALLGLTLLAAWLLHTTVLSPWRTLRFYRKQGLRGPAFRPFHGNWREMKDARLATPSTPIPIEENGMAQGIVPHVLLWRKLYAPEGTHRLVYQDMYVTEVLLWDARLAREFLTKAKLYKRDRTTKKLLKFFTGEGLVALDTGSFWEQQRKILNPAFRLQFIKGLHHHMIDAGHQLVQSWSEQVKASTSGSAEILVSREIKVATLNVISRATFGADVAGSALPVEVGKRAFQALDELQTGNQQARMTLKFHFPALSLFLPQSEAEKKLRRDDKFIDRILEEIVDARIRAVGSAYQKSTSSAPAPLVRNDSDSCQDNKGGHDLLGFMVDSMLRGSKTMTKAQILRECRTMFAAGQHTTAQTLAWVLLLLAHHTEWQEKAREEVRRVTANTGVFDADNADKLHVLGMIINETLRLYPPASIVSREAAVRHKLGDVDILPGTNVVLSVLLLHMDEQYWEEPKAFKPDRFERGVGAAARYCNQGELAYAPFGGGPRTCIGANFGLLEVKTVVAAILHRFSLQVSPNYQHIPSFSVSISSNAVLLQVKEL